MIQLTAQMRILVCVEPVDFRAGIDGLCRICRQVLMSDPLIHRHHVRPNLDRFVFFTDPTYQETTTRLERERSGCGWSDGSHQQLESLISDQSTKRCR